MVLAGTTICGAVSVSGDGSVIAGSCSGPNNSVPRAFRWTQQDGMTQLAMLPGGSTARAYGVSGDGSTIVGFATTPQGRRAAVRWTADGGIENLGLLPGMAHADALAVNGDGTAACGNSDAINTWGPSFIWTIRGGMVDLRAYLISQGVDLTGFSYLGVTAMSDDGTVVTGTGNYTACPGCFIEPVAYRVSGLPSPGCGSADIGRAGGLTGADNTLDNNDFIAFINLFFASDARADVGSAGGLPGADGLFNNNDFIAFINRFFAGC